MSPPRMRTIAVAQTLSLHLDALAHVTASPSTGSLLGAPVADWVGRQRGTFVAILVFCFGVAMQTGCHTIAVFVVGRVFAGLGVGLISTLIPMYLSECSPKWIRGAVVTGYQWAITIGLLLANVVNNATKDRNDHSSWRIPTAVQFIWAFILAVGMVFLPEVRKFIEIRSPLRYLTGGFHSLLVTW